MRSSTSPPSHTRRTALLVAAHLAVVVVGVWHHELWRDEWQAWMLARDSGSFVELLRWVSFEGHFPGWYTLLFVLGRFTRDPVAMQVAHVVIATGSIYLLARYAPFPWPLKVGAAFGYFLAYEYAVIARPYALGVLGLFLFCASWSRGERWSWRTVLALAILALSSIHGLVVAAAVVGMLLLDVATASSSPETRERRVLAWGGLLVWGMVLAAAATLVLILPLNALNGVPGASDLPLLSRWGLGSTVGTLAESYLPLPELLAAHPRETHLIGADSTLELALLSGLSVLLVVASVLMLLPRPLVLFLYVVGTGGLLLFSHLVFQGFMRHHGQLFVLFLGCLWLARATPVAWRPPAPLDRWSGTEARWARVVVAGILAVQVAAAAVLYVADLRRPFSVAGEVAAFLRVEGLEDLPILASPGPPASAVAGELDRPVHYLATGTTSTFIPWPRFTRGRDRNFSMQRLRPFLDENGPEVLVILGASHGEWDEDLEVTELARFEAGIERTEKYVVYRVEEVR